ncbi:hypothetical protein STAIW_v1c05760 [Spiroplasma taiwanense CT-1]|uniref:Uncharacterized protein n=1 Tax=Spiroplasma taiwanense CT-1 TaxID=1276220 RepID=S5MBR8_9MOLU|nr:hypothetical protein STAIW_v1c05760 [Spiroplasma taiwanense CT-1]
MALTATCNYSGCIAKTKKVSLGSYYCTYHFKLIKNTGKK